MTTSLTISRQNDVLRHFKAKYKKQRKDLIISFTISQQIILRRYSKTKYEKEYESSSRIMLKHRANSTQREILHLNH